MKPLMTLVLSLLALMLTAPLASASCLPHKFEYDVLKVSTGPVDLVDCLSGPLIGGGLAVQYAFGATAVVNNSGSDTIVQPPGWNAGFTIGHASGSWGNGTQMSTGWTVLNSTVSSPATVTPQCAGQAVGTSAYTRPNLAYCYIAQSIAGGSTIIVQAFANASFLSKPPCPSQVMDVTGNLYNRLISVGQNNNPGRYLTICTFYVLNSFSIPAGTAITAAWAGTWSWTAVSVFSIHKVGAAATSSGSTVSSISCTVPGATYNPTGWVANTGAACMIGVFQ